MRVAFSYERGTPACESWRQGLHDGPEGCVCTEMVCVCYFDRPCQYETYLRLTDFCITQLKAQRPSRTCDESEEEEEEKHMQQGMHHCSEGYVCLHV